MKKKLTKIAAVLASCLLLLPALVSCADDDVVNNQVITNEETQNPVINSALKYVSINYTASYAYETVIVPYLVDAGGGNCVTVEYKSSDESVVNTASASFGWIYVTKDLTAKTVTVTATASFGGASVSKEITVEVPACTEFEEDYYSSDTMTGYTKTSFDMENKTVISERKHSDSSISAKKYSFEFGENPGQLIVSFVAVKGESYCEDKNKWYTKDELLYSVPSVTQMLAAEADGTVFEYSIMKTDYSAENARKTYPKGAAIHAAAVYDSTKDWFDQCGTYRISIDDGEDFIIYCRNGSEIYWKDSEIEGTYNENHTVFTSSNGGTYELSDVKDEQSVIVGDGDRTCWLNFEGKSL